MEILFQLDVRTIVLLVAMTFFVQTTAIAAQAYLIRDLKQYQGIGTALVSNLLIAIGILLRLLDGYLPDLLTVIVANCLILLSPGLFYIALGQFNGLSYNRTLVSIITIVVLILLFYFTYSANYVGVRMIIVSIGAVAMVLLLVYQLVRMRRTTLRFSADLMLISFISYGTFLILRTIVLIMDPSQVLRDNAPVQSATYLLMFIFSFFWSTGFILLVSQRLRNDLMEVATIDSLTRIPNRRATQAFLEKELARTQRNGDSFSVLLIDIDRFKQINDRWGHAIGDGVLVQTAAIFQAIIRKHDWVGRWGGEEFLMVLAGVANAQSLAERVRSDVAAANYWSGSTSFSITVSIGVACATPENQIDEILKMADEALYNAKQTRNRVSVAG